MNSEGSLGRESEHGQMLLLFVAIFSVVLAMGAFALDQGLALGKHGVAQNAADAASRAGAYGCLRAISGGAAPTDACGAGEAAAMQNALANRAVATPTAGNDCGGTHLPSLSAVVEKQSPNLFSRFWLADGFNAKAIATSCVGAVSTLIPGGPDMIPVWFAQPPNAADSKDPNARNCGAGSGATFAGRACVVFSTDNLASSGAYYDPRGTCGPTDANAIKDAIRFGIGTLRCATQRTVSSYFGSSAWQQAVLDGFAARLRAGDSCGGGSSLMGGLRAAVKTLDGAAPRPAGATSGRPDVASTVYWQQTCDSPRLVLIPLVSASGATKVIQEFSAVYLIGCGTGKDGMPSSMNKCEASSRGQSGNNEGDNEDCEGKDACEKTRTRVWGIMLRMYLAGDAVQTIGSIDSSSGLGRAAALAIQTVK